MADIPLLSTGEPSTVENWVKLAKVFFGEDSKQVKFLESKATPENGMQEPIIAPEGELLQCLFFSFDALPYNEDI
jgi:hypothetical protein